MTTSDQQPRTDEIEVCLRCHAAKGTPWNQVLDIVKSNFSPADVACIIDRLNPSAPNLRSIYEDIKDHYPSTG